MAMDVVRVERKKTVCVAVNGADQPVLDPLADHGPLLARDGQHVVFNRWQDGLAEGYIEILGRPLRMAGRHVAELQMVHAKFARQVLRRIFQRCHGLGIDCRHAAIDGEGQGDQGVAEKPAPDMGKRQDSPDTGGVLRIEKMGRMPENLTDDLLPRRTMEEGRFGAIIDKRVPAQCARRVGLIEMPDRQHAFQTSVRNR